MANAIVLQDCVQEISYENEDEYRKASQKRFEDGELSGNVVVSGFEKLDEDEAGENHEDSDQHPTQLEAALMKNTTQWDNRIEALLRTDNLTQNPPSGRPK